ncbi:MAG: HD domain-containing protein [Deltaproteobacteria bacterium]|jgi:HD superfamily phosphohydrolase|nr:HD domain-containing protein [Deltaproteobacteria bacterium]MDA8305491.1 HD domain-containing protein [Deltaproteobacteria bacterium]
MTCTEEEELRQFHRGISRFAEEFVGNPLYRKQFPKNAKIIHDPLWGTIRLEPWEVALLDLPLFQRLRQIHQTSLVSYVFPGCNHSRFEHTLGVIQQAQRLIDAVNAQYPPTARRFEYETVRNLRLAALFHDCGHSCFSHISEEIYRSCPDILAFFDTDGSPQCNPHEVFGSLILKSDPVRQFIKELEEKYKITLNPDAAANYITGLPAEGRRRQRYEHQVINGPFDADKLDYIFRDAHYSGIPVGLDLERLWASCKIGTADGGADVLTLHQASVAPLEQVLFSKVNLFAIVYQHPKVRAAERMFQSIIETAKNNPDDISFINSGRKLNLNRATDYLWLTDEVFFAEALARERNDPLHKRLHDIRYRRLFVRALTISNDTIGKPGEGFLQLRKLNEKQADTYAAKRSLAGEILKAAKLDGKLDPGDVWVDLPYDPSFGEADRTYVHTASGSLRKVSELFPIHYWVELFQKHKWRGHVFCPQEYQQEIHEAAVDVLNNIYGIKFKKSAGETSHVPRPKETA